MPWWRSTLPAGMRNSSSGTSRANCLTPLRPPCPPPRRLLPPPTTRPPPFLPDPGVSCSTICPWISPPQRLRPRRRQHPRPLHRSTSRAAACRLAMPCTPQLSFRNRPDYSATPRHPSRQLHPHRFVFLFTSCSFPDVECFLIAWNTSRVRATR